MRLTTPVDTEKLRDDFLLGAGDGVMLLGSCFSDEIGRRLAADKFRCTANPFGTLYNPLSIRATMEQMLACMNLGAAAMRPLVERTTFQGPGNIWNSWLAASELSAMTREESQSRVIAAMERGAEALRTAKMLILTFGTNRAYFLRGASGETPVANCHKMPAASFFTTDAKPRDIAQGYVATLSKIFKANPSIRVVFTVSPYRYAKYGMHASALAKAALLLAVVEIIAALPGKCVYFPSMEIMLDELRDYRFYTEDMLHPTPQAASYIYSRFCECVFSANAAAFTARWRRIAKTLAHRPQFPQSPDYRALMASVAKDVDSLIRDFPRVDLEQEKTRLSAN